MAGRCRGLPIKPDGTEGRWRWEPRQVQVVGMTNLTCSTKAMACSECSAIRRQFRRSASRRLSGSMTRQDRRIRRRRIKGDFAQRQCSATPKPTQLIKNIVSRSTEIWILLFWMHFAGSGTTGHAVIELNREDGGRRKFILVEMGDYFDTVLLPRLKKGHLHARMEGRQAEAASPTPRGNRTQPRHNQRSSASNPTRTRSTIWNHAAPAKQNDLLAVR